MINLLPDERKHDIQAARMNVVLLRYNLLVIVAIVFLAITCAFFYLVLQNAQTQAASTSTVNATKAQSYAKIRAEADTYRNNLGVAKIILNNSVNYSSFLFSLTKLLPSGVILDGVTLSASSFDQQTSFVARATSFQKATELKERFQNSKLFTNVYFQSLTDNAMTDANGVPEEYPIVVTISAKFNKVAQP